MINVGERITVFASNSMGLVPKMSIPVKSVEPDGETMRVSTGKNYYNLICVEGSHQSAFYLHNTRGPAITLEGSYGFCINGHNMAIEDMPIDDDIKVMLLLKYSYKCMTSNGWRIYA